MSSANEYNMMFKVPDSDLEEFLINSVMNAAQEWKSFCGDFVKADAIYENEYFKTIVDSIVKENGGIPDDIITSQTVPLTNISIEIDSIMADVHINYAKEDGNTREILENYEEYENAIDLLLITGWIHFHSKDLSSSIFVSLYSTLSKKILMPYSPVDLDENSKLSIYNIMKLWYGIQILLLHPRVEVIERKAVLQKLKGKDKITATSTGRKVKYIKRYYITPEDIDLMINGDRHYKRKCLSWYVIGHYREYKNGKRIFIQGYWKGELRALKRNFDERERVV